MVGEVTGFLHIVRVDAPVDPVTAEYRIAFAPLGGRASESARGGPRARPAHGVPPAGARPDAGDRARVAGACHPAGSLDPARRAHAHPDRGARALGRSAPRRVKSRTRAAFSGARGTELGDAITACGPATPEHTAGRHRTPPGPLPPRREIFPFELEAAALGERGDQGARWPTPGYLGPEGLPVTSIGRGRGEGGC